MIEKAAVIQNRHGIHCRPSALIIKSLGDYDGTVEICSETGTVDCRSIMGLLTLGLEYKACITLRVSGPDEEETCERLAVLFETEFDFPPR